MDWLAPLAEKQGFVLLRNWDYGFRNLTNSVRPINVPDDVKGLKIRTPPELQIQASMEALGAVVQAIAFPELYLALSQKVVDGQENPIPVIYFNKIYEVQKHLALTRHIYNNMIHTIGVNSWKKLTPDQQAIFREESKNSGKLMRKLMADSEADQIDKLQKAGMQITRPDLAPFRAKMDPAYKRIADYAGEDNVKKFREIVDKSRKTQFFRGDGAKADGHSRAAAKRRAGRSMGYDATMQLLKRGATDAPFVYTAKKYAETKDASLIWEGHKAGRHIGYCHIEKPHNLQLLPSTGLTVSGWTRAVDAPGKPA